MPQRPADVVACMEANQAMRKHIGVANPFPYNRVYRTHPLPDLGLLYLNSILHVFFLD